jgi:hypothetical protein
MNPFAQSDLERELPPARFPSERIEGMFPTQADAFQMGGAADMSSYKFQDNPQAVWGAYDRAQAQRAKEEAQLQAYQRNADKMRVLRGAGEGPEDIRTPFTGQNPVQVQQQADRLGDILAPSDVFDAATYFNPAKRLGAIGRAIPAAAGVALGSDPAEAGVRDPRFWHGISGVKLRKPLEEYSSVHTERVPMLGKTANLDALKGQMLYPTVGDTTIPNTYLHQIEDYRLPERVAMQGGGRFPDVQGNTDVWMSAQSPLTGMARGVADVGRRTGRDVVVVPTALSGTGGDYSHHVYQPLVDRLKDTKGISNDARDAFDKALREIDPDFPGTRARRATLHQYYDEASRTPRTAFAQLMDTRRFQDMGFPDVAAVRHAATDPALLHAPLGSSGFSSFRVDPASVHPSTSHGTYSHGIRGENVGGFGVIAPPDIVFPDVMDSLRKMSKASGKPLIKYTGRPDYYFQGRIPSKLGDTPLAQAQLVDDKWLNRFGDYAERYKKVGGAAALASGMTLAEIAAAQDAKAPPMGGFAAQDAYVP